MVITLGSKVTNKHPGSDQPQQLLAGDATITVTDSQSWVDVVKRKDPL